VRGECAKSVNFLIVHQQESGNLVPTSYFARY
jgi:hypothetical protein